MPTESPTRITSIPALSSSRAIVESYAVSTETFSPRSFIALRSGTRTGFIYSLETSEALPIEYRRLSAFACGGTAKHARLVGRDQFVMYLPPHDVGAQRRHNHVVEIQQRHQRRAQEIEPSVVRQGRRRKNCLHC